MRPKSLLLLALALGCGLIASIGISQVMESNRKGTTDVEKEAIYIAKVNINTGDPISTEMVMLKDWPKGDVPPGAIRTLENLEDRRPRTPVFQGEPILESKLLNPGESSDPTQHIPKGFRIVPISVRADTGAAGLLRPGDRVDVQWYVARNPRIGVNETVTKTILHNIRVFAVDQTVTRPVNGEEAPKLAKTISLLLNPKQANKVQLAIKMGDISLIPRHPEDPTGDDSAVVTFDDLVTESDKNSRAVEQGRLQAAADRAGPGFFGDLMSKLAAGAAAAAAVQPTPPFEMELVMGDDVQHQMFDPESGRPLRDLGSRAGLSPILPRHTNGNATSEVGFKRNVNPITNGETQSEPPEEHRELLEDVPGSHPGFPIDFGDPAEESQE